MDGGLGTFIPGVTIGLTFAIGIYRARDHQPWKSGIAIGLVLAGAMFLLLDRAGTDFERLWILVWILGSVAAAAAIASVASAVRRRRDPSPGEPHSNPA